MKTLIPLMLLTVVGCATHAQPRTALPVPPPPPDEDIVIAQASRPRASATAAIAPLPPDAPGAPHGLAAAWAGPIKYGLSGGSSSRRTLVIPKGDANAEMLTDAEEDLNVMTLILEKAVDTRSEDEGKKALGIDIFSSSSGIRNLFIEGQGVIFTLKTKMALVPPPTPKKDDPKPKEQTSSEWEDAKRQLYGPSDIEREIHRTIGKIEMSFNSSEAYDEQKLKRLKDSLVEALKSGANIRHLSGDQTVTVVVLSSSPVADVRKIVSESRGGSRRELDVYAKGERIESRSGSRLLLQAKKTDIDSYAKGKLNTDAFREKVKIQIY